MALNLQKNIVRKAVTSTVICFVVSIVLGLLVGAITFKSANVAWLIVLAMGIGLFGGWRMIVKIKTGIVNSVSKQISYVRVVRETQTGDGKFDWNAIDDYAVQLGTRGFSTLGDFTTYPQPTHFIAAAALFINTSKSIVVEVQHIQMHAANPGTKRNLNGIHFSITSVVGGNIRVVTTDHSVAASNYLIRGDNNVFASYPDMGLMALLDKHEQLLATLRERTGKSANSGLTAERCILLIREALLQARRRLEGMNGYEMAKQVDAFEANPMTTWAPPTAKLAALAERSLDDLDASEASQGLSPIIEASMPAGIAVSSATTSDPVEGLTDNGSAETLAVDDSHAIALKERTVSGANWFYWIAGLSLVNAVAGALGSDWGFAIGLGIPQILSAIAQGLPGAERSFTAIGLLYGASFAVTGFFAACGWFSRRPSTVAFLVGFVVFAIDSLIFLMASDWIGLGFHALALFYIWNGFSAARQLKKHLQGYAYIA